MEAVQDDDVETIYRRALSNYAELRMPALARKVIYCLQRQKASGIFGDDYSHKTLWDELSHNIQSGSYDDGIDDALDEIAAQAIAGVTEKVAAEELTLFGLANPDYEPDGGGIAHYAGKSIERAVVELAGARNLDRFDPNGDDW